MTSTLIFCNDLGRALNGREFSWGDFGVGILAGVMLTIIIFTIKKL